MIELCFDKPIIELKISEVKNAFTTPTLWSITAYQRSTLQSVDCFPT